MPAWVSDLPDWTGLEARPIERPAAEPATASQGTVAAAPQADGQPGGAARPATREELVKRAMQLGLKGSGTTADLVAAIAAKEATLAAGGDVG